MVFPQLGREVGSIEIVILVRAARDRAEDGAFASGLRRTTDAPEPAAVAWRQLLDCGIRRAVGGQRLPHRKGMPAFPPAPTWSL